MNQLQTNVTFYKGLSLCPIYVVLCIQNYYLFVIYEWTRFDRDQTTRNTSQNHLDKEGPSLFLASDQTVLVFLRFSLRPTFQYKTLLSLKVFLSVMCACVMAAASRSSCITDLTVHRPSLGLTSIFIKLNNSFSKFRRFHAIDVYLN